MKNLSLSIIAIIGLAANCMAQDLTHEKKTIVGEDGKIYWNKELPVYITLSSSSDGNNAHLLKEEKKSSEPFYLDTEGTNWIRSRWAVDESGNTIYPKRDALWPVEADGVAPTSSAKFISTGKKIVNGVTYYSSDLKVELSSTDKTSGVDKIYYSTSAGFLPYNSSVNINTEKSWELKYYAVDKVGNVEKLHDTKSDKTTSFDVDATAPTTKYEIAGANVDNILSPRTLIKLNSNDEKSGVQKINYTWDNGKGVRYYGPIGIGSLEEGEHTLSFYATDNVENAEAQKQYKIFLDKSGPTLSLAFTKDSFEKKGKTFVSERASIDLSGVDNKSGLDKIRKNHDKKGYSTYTEALSAGKDGYHTISYFGYDKVENKSKVIWKEYIVDGKAPSISYRVKGPKYTRRDTLFVRSISEFVITTADARWNDAGVKSVKYVVDGLEKEFDSNFTLSGDGVRKVNMRTMDNVNNVSDVIAQVVYIDNKAPAINHHFSVDKIGTKTVRGKSLVIYPKDAKLYLAATDKHVGVNKVYYKINGGTEKSYVSPIGFASYSNITIDIRTVDHLGNENTNKIEFAVE
jgi:hypothetical protein